MPRTAKMKNERILVLTHQMVNFGNFLLQIESYEDEVDGTLP